MNSLIRVFLVIALICVLTLETRADDNDFCWKSFGLFDTAFTRVSGVHHYLKSGGHFYEVNVTRDLELEYPKHRDTGIVFSQAKFNEKSKTWFELRGTLCAIDDKIKCNENHYLKKGLEHTSLVINTGDDCLLFVDSKRGVKSRRLTPTNTIVECSSTVAQKLIKELGQVSGDVIGGFHLVKENTILIFCRDGNRITYCSYDIGSDTFDRKIFEFNPCKDEGLGIAFISIGLFYLIVLGVIPLCLLVPYMKKEEEEGLISDVDSTTLTES